MNRALAMPKKILTIIGARPQFIKAAPIAKAFKNSHYLVEILVHTGQHYDSAMSEIFFSELEIPAPKYNLEVGSATHAIQTAEIMKRLEEVMLKEKPDLVLIYGDTNSTLAGALTAAKLHIPIAHIEAGLRSFNRKMPEEINRIVTDVLSSIHFTPTQTAADNLRREGIASNVYNCGDVMYDAALQAAEKARKQSSIMQRLFLNPKRFILATIHRAENTDDQHRLTSIFSAFNQIASTIPIVLPLHPRTKKFLGLYSLEESARNLLIIDPIGYLDMVSLENNAQLIITDSGGVQKEAYFYHVPCVTLRDETEWVETIAAGWNQLADVSAVANIVNAAQTMLTDKIVRNEIAEYGVGMAAKQIVAALEKYLNKDPINIKGANYPGSQITIKQSCLTGNSNEHSTY
jgi:UDP-GlcNAc3NAcA epimerase